MTRARVVLLCECTLAAAFLLAWQGGTGSATSGQIPVQSGLRIALRKQPFIPNRTSNGPQTMASGGIKASSRSWARGAQTEIALTQNRSRSMWKETAGLCPRPSRPGGGGQRTRGVFQAVARHVPVDGGHGGRPPALGPDDWTGKDRLLWLDAHPDLDTPETTLSG